MKPVTLGLYSWLRKRNTMGEKKKGFSGIHKEMNRGCRGRANMCITQWYKDSPLGEFGFVKENPPYLFCSGCRSVNAAPGETLPAACKDSNIFANEPVPPI